MSKELAVADIRLDVDAEQTTLSGAVDDHRLFWRMTSRPSISIRGEPFVAALLVPAMRAHRTLVLPGNAPVDETFLANVAELQQIFVRWFPDLRPVAIEASIADRVGTAGRFTGYSGGVDSSYTIMQLGHALDGAVLLDGIDYGDVRPNLMSEVTAALGAEMTRRGLPLVVVGTNAKAVAKRLGGEWSQAIGGILASAPHALGAAEYSIAGSNSWENARPYGTHPYTDPLWSSAAVTIRHHGANLRRIDKLARLADDDQLLDALRVCYEGTDYNCGRCAKCLQTSAGMRALQVTSAAMPPLSDPRILRQTAVSTDGDLVDWAEIISPEVMRRDPELSRELHRLTGRYRRRRLFRTADDVLLGGRLRKMLGLGKR